jgi:hypothetical protein
VMPFTLPVPVVLAGATGGPVCSGTPSNPTVGCDALDVEVAVPAALEVPVLAALVVPVLAPELELEFEEPHAARLSAHNSAVAKGITGRMRSAKVAGCAAPGVGSVCGDV